MCLVMEPCLVIGAGKGPPKQKVKKGEIGAMQKCGGFVDDNGADALIWPTEKETESRSNKGTRGIAK